MAISKVGLGWPVGERNYTTLNDWVVAKKASGTYEEAWCSGNLGTSFVTIGASDFPQGALIRGDVQYTGANHSAIANIPRSITVSSTTAAITIRDLNVTNPNSTQPALNIAGANVVAERCYIWQTTNPGSNAATLMTGNGATAKNCVVINTLTSASKVARPSSTGILQNCVVIGGGIAIQSEWTNSKTEKCYSVNATTSCYVWNNGRPPANITNASSDTTGDAGFRDLTALTNFVDYANSDYRIRSSSPLNAAGIGAFFEPAGERQNKSSSASALQLCSAVADTSAINAQQFLTNGSATQAATSTADTTASNTQQKATAGSAQQSATATADASARNGQHRQVTGTSAQSATGTADTTATNSQNKTSAGSAGQLCSAQADTAPINNQHRQSAGQLPTVAGFIADTSWVNTVDIGEVQHRATAGSASQSATATATATALNSQHSQTSGTSAQAATSNADTTASNSQHRQSAAELRSVAGFIASTSWVNTVDLGNIQHRGTSGSTTQAVSADATATAINGQKRQSSAHGAAEFTATAGTSRVNVILQKAVYIRRIETQSISKKIYRTASRHKIWLKTQSGGGYMQELNFKQGASALLQIEHTVDNEPVSGISEAKYELYGRMGQVLVTKTLGAGIEFSAGLIEIELTENDTATLSSSYTHQCVARDLAGLKFYPLNGAITFGATKPRL